MADEKRSNQQKYGGHGEGSHAESATKVAERTIDPAAPNNAGITPGSMQRHCDDPGDQAQGEER